MTESLSFAPLVGRTVEIRELYTKICEERCPALIVSGASGVGKTAVADHFATLMRGGPSSFRRVWFQSLYRTSWTSTLADIRRRLDRVPQNATVEELENLTLSSCQNDPTLIILDNADDGNVADIAHFVERWQNEVTNSSLVITAQLHIAQQFQGRVPLMQLSGIQSAGAVLEIMGELRERFSEDDLLEISALVGGNPQKLLFLNWLAPTRMEELRARAANLQREHDHLAVEELIESAGIPSLFFLALGVHRSLVVPDQLLSALWDNFSSRSAAAYVRARDTLIKRKVLTPIGDYKFSIHELVHLQLEKALLHHVGQAETHAFYAFFARFYERELHAEVTTSNLIHFIDHSISAKSYRLAFRPVVDGRTAQALAARGSAVLVRQELEKLDTPECLAHAGSLGEVSLCLRLGGLCNDLSDHSATLRYMTRAESALTKTEGSETGSRRRQIWYYRAVSFSNLGQSDRCLQEYFRIVDSCASPQDDLACLSLGYLAHDIKYRDLSLAIELGRTSFEWAAEYHPQRLLPRNACSYAESLVVANRAPEAAELFAKAAAWADEQHDSRELGRIQTNWGFALAVDGDAEAISLLEKGRTASASVGDRRRQTQALLYTGVARCLASEWQDGQRLIRQAMDLLRVLGDGRYFIPALCWALQLDGIPPRLYPIDQPTAERIQGAGYAASLQHATEHPEFDVYHQFWWRHFSDLIRR